MDARILTAVALWFGSIACFAQDVSPLIAVVKGAPFTAQAVTESTQMLADGNRIVHKSTASIARDGEGRVRREQTIMGGLPSADTGPSIVFIQDPVAGFAYLVDSSSRSVHKIAVSGREMDATRAGENASTPSGINETLGRQFIEGLEAYGTRNTRTLQVGEAGNDRPLEIVSDSWYSPELQTIVVSRRIDPRLGETTYRLTDIQRGEPTHSLFEIPANYIQDEVHTARDRLR